MYKRQQLTHRCAKDAVVSGIQERAAGDHHLLAVAGSLGAHACLLYTSDYDALERTLEFLANNSAAVAAQALPGQWNAASGTYTVTDLSLIHI